MYIYKRFDLIAFKTLTGLVNDKKKKRCKLVLYLFSSK